MGVAEIASLPAVFVRQLARFKRVFLFASSMEAAAALGVALAISKVTSSNTTDQQAENTKHEKILDGGLA